MPRDQRGLLSARKEKKKKKKAELALGLKLTRNAKGVL
jgi:hypothetical protein